jgi:hypothetical protein
MTILIGEDEEPGPFSQLALMTIAMIVVAVLWIAVEIWT